MRYARHRAGWVWPALVGLMLAGGFVGGRRWAAVADEPIPTPLAPVPPSPAPDVPAPVPAPVAAKPVFLTLDKAAAGGLVSIRGEKPSSYEQVDLVLTNKTDQPLRLDLAGRHLKPTTGGCQRLGLSHPLTPSDRPPEASTGTWPVELAPNEVRTVRMHTCCLDAGRSCPGPSDRFELASEPTKPAVEQALRWWTDHRTASQGFVNHAIWSNDVRLLNQPYEVRAADGTPTPIGPKGRKIRSYAGIVYTLVEGALTSVDIDGVRRFHGTQIYDLLPRADALYGVVGATVGYDLLRFAPTGEPPYARVFAIAAPTELADFLPVVGGAYLTRTGDELLSWRATKDAAATSAIVTAKATRLTVGPVDASKGRYAVVVHQSGTPKPGSEGVGPGALSASAAKFVVYDLDGRTGASELRKIFWNARDMVAGPGGVFALSPVGTPEKLEGEKLRRLPTTDEFESIVLVGAAHLVLRTKGGVLVGYDVKTGRTSPLPASASSSWGPDSGLSIDPVTDDVVWVGEHDFLRWRFGAPSAEVIP